MNIDSEPELLDTLREVGVDPDTLVTNARGTLRAPTSLTSAPVVELPSLARDQLQVIDRLGSGGFGVVERAVQVPLSREVAVKRASRGDDDHDDLIIEARITGHLEHPNVVPVYALGRDESGETVLVMKRIEGGAWSELLESEPDDFERHLDVLIEVCRAAHFAHERGVLHRDLKPENVMLGAFGEVYVLDWGIAVGLDPSAPSTTRTSTTESIVGTPGFMAPEMCTPGAHLDRRTDVYLLGAILYRILTGHRAHCRGSLRAAHVIARTLIADGADPGPAAADELRELCVRATRRDPDDRFASADELRVALERFRARAATLRLLKEASARIATIDDEDDAVATRAYYEARFGIDQALREWPELTPAREAQQTARERRAWRELRLGRVDVAAQVAMEMDVVPPALATALGEAETQRKKANALVVEYDPRRGQRTRGITAAIVALVSGGGLSVLGWLDFIGAREVHLHELLLVNSVVFLCYLVVIASRGIWRQNIVSKQLAAAATLNWVALLGINVGAMQLGLSCAEFGASLSWALALGFGVMSLSDRRFTVSAVAFAVGAILIPFLPEASLLINGVSTIFGLGILAVNLMRVPEPAASADAHPEI